MLQKNRGIIISFIIGLTIGAIVVAFWGKSNVDVSYIDDEIKKLEDELECAKILHEEAINNTNSLLATIHAKTIDVDYWRYKFYNNQIEPHDVFILREHFLNNPTSDTTRINKLKLLFSENGIPVYK